MTRDELLTELRATLKESTIDFAWGDTRLLLLLEEAQDMFCEDTGLFLDATNYTIDTVVGQASYDIPSRVIEVIDVFDADGRRLGFYREGDKYPSTVPGAASTEFNTTNPVPSSWQADYELGRLKLYPVPTTISTLTLRVWRYSQFALTNEDIDGNGTAASPELPNHLQRACIHWAAHMALVDHDMEVEDGVKSADHLAIYRQYVTRGKRYVNRLRGARTRIGGNPLYVV